ncbi:uncharacterized protein C18orf19 homolog A-like [Leguminivora glycinivorella]|uniref:uncharacterized protein C18orf19 homolog A-like n=1 Tax=Leguminivora glycinivorella TaxID=1035111 RepID=UPI0020100D77|nr:uncharacterized protein C18orf19 homolog A-like [Leguminivora glycinivorella]
MSHSLKLLYRQTQCFLNITTPVRCSANQYPIRILARGISYQNNPSWNTLKSVKFNSISSCQIRNYIKPEGNNACCTPEKPTPPEKQGLFQKFKDMYKNYWYVLVPVHMATSAVWLGSFYYTVRSGVDIIPMLEALGISEKLIEPMKNSTAGYYALTFALYKIATPLRYAVTVGGTTLAIRKLTALGLIKPVPSRQQFKEMLLERKDDFQDRFKESKAHYRTQMRQQGTKVMDEMRRYKTEIRNMKNKVKKM